MAGSFPHCLRTSISLNGSFLRKTVNYCGNLLILFCSGMYLQIGQYISSNGCVVAAEELAPFLDVKTTEDMVCIAMFILSTLYDDVVTLL